MKPLHILSVTPFLALLAALPAAAASSGWSEHEGAAVRIVTAGVPDADGRLRGMLDIRLKPGWKTYWRDPGDAGVPPQIDTAGSQGIASAELSFPAPQRHDDGYNVWAGYDHPVALPITFTLAEAGATSTISASVFLGVCETICVPVQASFTLAPGTDDPADTAAVEAAFAALPAPADAGFEARSAGLAGDGLTVETTIPEGAAFVDLFVASEGGYVVGAPEPGTAVGSVVLPLLDRPAQPPAGPGLPYTLVTDRGAVSGMLPYP